MSPFEPSRMPAGGAGLGGGRSPTPAAGSVVGVQRAKAGALPSRIASRRTGRASPSISRNMMPGHVRAPRTLPRRAMPRVTSGCTCRRRWAGHHPQDEVTAAIRIAPPGTCPRTSRRGCRRAIRAPPTGRTRRPAGSSTNPVTSISGSRRAASSGGAPALHQGDDGRHQEGRRPSVQADSRQHRRRHPTAAAPISRTRSAGRGRCAASPLQCTCSP